MLPKGTARATGIGFISLAPAAAVILQLFGVPAECSPEAVDMGCITASQIAVALMTAIGGGIYAWGQNRDNRNIEQIATDAKTALIAQSKTKPE